MSRVCEICGKGPQYGAQISHAHNVSKKRWNPNIKKIRVLPVWLMKSTARFMEYISRLTGKQPLTTRTAIDFLRFPGVYSIEKAQKLLNYRPPFNKEKAFQITREYLRAKYATTP